VGEEGIPVRKCLSGVLCGMSIFLIDKGGIFHLAFLLRKVPTPGFFFLATIISIFVAEALVMLLLDRYPLLSSYNEVIIDSTLL
jgi:hypothetical protein